MRDARLRRFVVAHLVTIVGEWAAVVGSLLYAYTHGGSATVGLVSLAVLLPAVLGASLAAAAVGRASPSTVRLCGFAVQVLAYGGATVAAAADAPIAIVTACIVIGVGAVGTLRPTGAVMLPALVRSTRDLTRGNLAVSYCDSASALLGPLAAAVAAGLGDAAAVFGTCAALAAIAFVATASNPLRRTARRGSATTRQPVARHALRTAVGELRLRRWGVGVLCVSAARNVLVGAFDVLLVVVALRSLRMGDGGPGVLAALVGAGAVLSVFVTTAVVRRARLSPTLLAALVFSGAACITLGLWTKAPVVFVLLPALGIAISSMDNVSRILLQRSTDPRNLGPLFACLGAVSGGGQLVGSGLAQLLLAVSGLRAALGGVGIVMVVIAATTARALRDADGNADVPVVEMSLLSGLPMFAPLPAASLEAVARAATFVEVADGEAVVVQGAEGDTFYAVSSGAFDVVMSGELVRTARRGDFFGEVALLAAVPRTATVTARGSGELLAVDREPFLIAITQHDVARATAGSHVRSLAFSADVDFTVDVADALRPTAGDH